MIEIQTRLLGAPLGRDQLDKLGAYAKRLIEEQGADPADMLRWAAHYTTRRSENPKIQPSHAWADVASGTAINGTARHRDTGSTAVVGANEDLFEGDF